MTYTDDNGNSMVAEGAAVLSADGSRYMTNQYNGFGGNQAYETYLVQFSSKTAVDVVYDNSVVVYPNPTSDYIVVEGKDGEYVSIYDLGGKCVYQSTMQGARCSIDSSVLSAGTYVVKCGSASCKIIVK
jgi:hypothetical protein